MEFPVSEDNEALLCKAMVDGAADALAGYPTSIDQDLARLRTGELAKGSREEVGAVGLEALLNEACSCSWHWSSRYLCMRCDDEPMHLAHALYWVVVPHHGPWSQATDAIQQHSSASDLTSSSQGSLIVHQNKLPC